jgi:hypothetical protein
VGSRVDLEVLGKKRSLAPNLNRNIIIGYNFFRDLKPEK